MEIEPERTIAVRISASHVLSALGPDSLAEFTAVRSDGKVIWCNFDLARQLGFEVPRSNQMTPDLENQLLEAFSFRAVTTPDRVQNQMTITMYADRYGGDGVRPGRGAGRAGFLPYGNLYIKGVGLTPLFRHNNADDFAHSHGDLHLSDCLTEAVFGEVDENLFAHGSTRVVTIIDQGRYVSPPSGKRIPVALVVRAGMQLRPAHMLVNHSTRDQSLLDKFIRITRTTGQLVTRKNGSKGGEIADVKSTALRIIHDHARTAADGFRWRMIHGAISSSNMEMSGAMLDLATQSTQPRTAPVWLLDYDDAAFGTDHRARALRLTQAYRKLVRETPISKRKQFNVKWLDIAKEMEKAYAQHLQMSLLNACGLKAEVARRIRAERPDLASRLTNLILEMAALKNPGSVCVARSLVEDVSVLDVFHLLKTLPSVYFEDTVADHKPEIIKLLKPVFKGNRFQMAKKQAGVALLAGKFANCYRELIDACQDYAEEYYGDLKSMRASISNRAEFENEPLDLLYYRRLQADLNKAIASYKSTGDATVIRQAIDQRILASLRSVEALLDQGRSRRLPGGGMEIEMRTINGISYSVRAWNDSEQTRRLHVSIFAERSGTRYLTSVAGLGCLTARQIQSLRYRFTFDGGGSFADVRASLMPDGPQGLVIDFDDICKFPLVGRLEGTFRARGNIASQSSEILGRYVFAIPDRQELIEIIERSLLDEKLQRQQHYTRQERTR